MTIVSGVVDAYYNAAAQATTALASVSDLQSATNIKATCQGVSPFKKLIDTGLGALFGVFALIGFVIFLFALFKFLAVQKKRGEAAGQMVGGLAALLLFGGGSLYFFGFLSGFGMAPPCL